MRRRLRVAVLPLSVMLAAAVLVGCEPTLQQETGVVIEVESPALGRVDSFVLATGDGERLTFDTSELEFRSEFPASHLGEHKVIGDVIEVTYKTDGDRLVVTQLDDRNH